MARYYAHKRLLRKNKVHDTICHSFMDIDETVEDMNRLYCKYSELKKENEELKKTIREVCKLLIKEVDIFSDEATENDLKAYGEMLQFDNKDAYYIAVATKKAIELLKKELK